MKTATLSEMEDGDVVAEGKRMQADKVSSVLAIIDGDRWLTLLSLLHQQLKYVQTFNSNNSFPAFSDLWACLFEAVLN